MKAVAIVFWKELLDALRDRRTLLRVALPGLLVGPLMLFFLSTMVSQFEAQAEKRTVSAIGLEAAPTLRNYLERQNYRIEVVKDQAAYEAQLRDAKVNAPLLLVPADFEARLARGEAAQLEVLSDSANNRAMAGVGTLARLVRGFNDERAQLGLMVRGVSPALLQPVELTERDLASQSARATRLTTIVPMFVIMAVLYGCLTAALDSTSGERERGSLEPLLTNPVPHGQLVAGKWAAVALMGMGVAVLASFSFLPAQWLIQSDALAAQFRFGALDAALFSLLLLPVACAMAALMMAVAIRTKTFKEAQASANLVIMVFSFLPLIPILNPGGDAAWHYAVPGLAQYQQMMLVLKGEALRVGQWLPTLLSSALILAAGLFYVARQMRAAASR